MYDRPIYKTWIRKQKLILFWILFIIILILALIPINFFLQIVLLIISLPFFYISILLTYSHLQFSERGGEYQTKIHMLLINKLEWTGVGEVIDIGTGSGSIAIKIAKSFPQAKIKAIDYWGKDWEYSQTLSQNNARIEGVEQQIEFIKASASKLPFNDNEFDAAVSCLTFHEVKDEHEKIKVLKEALRVIKPGGVFVFLDLFLEKKVYGEFDSFKSQITGLNLENWNLSKLDQEMKIPRPLLHGKVLGKAMIFEGKK